MTLKDIIFACRESKSRVCVNDPDGWWEYVPVDEHSPEALLSREVAKLVATDKDSMMVTLVSRNVELGYRVCSVCGRPMSEGYCYNGGESYYCGEDCLHAVFPGEAWEECVADGDSYWTTWD